MHTIEAGIVGTFGMSDEFIHATADVYSQMQEVVRESGMSYVKLPFGQAQEYFGQVDNTGAKIISSFLGRIASDVESISIDEDSKIMSDRPLILHMLGVFNANKPAGDLHVDDIVAGLSLGVRYLTSNRYPTAIPKLGLQRAGVIARMPHGRTMHQQPDFYASRQLPRVLLSADV